MPDKASIRVRLIESQVADCVTMPRDCVYEFYQKRFLSDADAAVSALLRQVPSIAPHTRTMPRRLRVTCLTALLPVICDAAIQVYAKECDGATTHYWTTGCGCQALWVCRRGQEAPE